MGSEGRARDESVTAADGNTDPQTPTLVPERDFPSLDIALEQAKYLLELENQRGERLEAKASLLLGAGGSLLALFLFADDLALRFRALLSGAVILSMVAAAMSTWLRRYAVPSYEPLFARARMAPAAAKDKFLVDFYNSLERNQRVNNGKLGWLRVSLVLLLLTVSLIGFALVKAAFHG